MFQLNDLKFDISGSYICVCSTSDEKLGCYLEIETVEIERDDEVWAPTLSHQGLLFNAGSLQDLVNTTHYWKGGYDKNCDNPHPEIGMLYVFGHENTRENRITFGEIKGNEIEFSWSGIADVDWDEEYGQNVPFKVSTFLKIKNV